ncbi:Uncharacterised protein [[Flavobacterium] thermophilum]|nr:Uncharacterised protein [[Flavobacterium] thermophilum]
MSFGDIYRDPLIYQWYDTRFQYTETIRVVGGKALLTYVPDEFQRVTIIGKYETVNTPQNSNEYKVNYQTGFIEFHTSVADNTALTATYYARGIIKHPAARTMILDNGNLITADNVEDALQEIVTKINSNNSRITQIEQNAINRHNSHVNSSTAHAAENITFSSSQVTGVSNVKSAIEKVDTRINNIVGQAGQSNTEIVDARLGVDGTAHPTLKSRLDKMENEQVKSNQQTTTLTHGLNIINASQNSPLDVRIEGRTLVNLLGQAGDCEDVSKWSEYQTTRTTDSSNFVYSTSGMKVTIKSGFYIGSTFHTILGGLKANKYYILIGEVKNGNASKGVKIGFGGSGSDLGTSAVIDDTSKFNTVWVKANPKIDKVVVNVDLIVDGNEGQYGYFDGIRLYEITAEEYANIGTVWNDEEVARRYPYVDSVQHVQNPYVIAEGENLLPPFTEWTLHANAIVKSPYELELNATEGYQDSYVLIPVIKNQTYTISQEGTGRIYIATYDRINGTLVSTKVDTTNKTATFTITESNVSYIKVVFSCTTSGTFSFINPMLTLGSQPKPFVPRNPSMLLISGGTKTIAGVRL